MMARKELKLMIIGRKLIILVGMLLCLNGSMKTQAASLPKQIEMWFVTHSGGSEIRGNHLICMTNCTPETTVKKITCSSGKIKAEMHQWWSGEDIGEGEPDFDHGVNSTIDLSTKKTKKGYVKLKDKMRVKLTVLVSEGDKEETLTTTVVFKEATVSRMFKSIKFNGKVFKPKQGKVRSWYRVKFKQTKDFKTVVTLKKGVRILSVVYHYATGNTVTSGKSIKFGKRVPARNGSATVTNMQISFVPPFEKQAGITKGQEKLLAMASNEGVLSRQDLVIEFAS